MRVTLLGTGTSTGVPVIGCRCDTCRSPDPRDTRCRPSIAIRLDDGTTVLVDASPDLRAQALRHGLDRVDLILLTHSHADHVLGLDDVRVYNFRQRAAIPCQGDSRTLADVRRMFAYVFDPKTPKGGGLPQLSLCPIGGPFSFGRTVFVPVPLRHGTLPILGYRVGAFAYLTDCSEIPDSSWSQLVGLEVLVIGALRRRKHSTHFNVDEAVDAARRIGADRTFFTHMSHDLRHEETCATLPDGVTLGHDGLELTVDETTPESALEAAASQLAAMHE